MRATALVLAAMVAFAWAGWRWANDRATAPHDPTPRALAPTAVIDPVAGDMPDGGAPAAAGVTDPDVIAAFDATPVAFARPRTLTVDQSAQLELVVDASGEGAPARQLRAADGPDVVEAQVDQDASVSAHLSGEGLVIERQTPERQALSETNANRWRWSVRAEAPGERALRLEIYIYPAGGAVAQPVKAYQDLIIVSAGPVGGLLAAARTAQPVIGLIAGLTCLTLAAATLASSRGRREPA